MGLCYKPMISATVGLGECKFKAQVGNLSRLCIILKREKKSVNIQSQSSAYLPCTNP